MARDWLETLGPDKAMPLTALEVKFLDRGPGVYAAWLVDRDAIQDCGLSATEPVPIYVGKATSGLGLPTRLFGHVRVAMLELVDILALHGRALSPFAARRPIRIDEPYRSDFDPLTDLADQQAMAWQRAHVHWSLLRCAQPEAAPTERSAIRALTPLLNLKGLPRYPPPQMRIGAHSQRAQAQWLWHMSWAGLLFGDAKGAITEREADRWRLEDAAARYESDELGYPVAPPVRRRLVRRTVGIDDCPRGDALWELFRDAARDATPEVKHGLGRSGLEDDNLEMWWAAHAAAPLLRNACCVEDAIAISLKITTAAQRPGPSRLPNPERCEELWRLTTLLPRYRH